MSSRRRMSPEQRREALLDTGEELFGSSGRFEDLSMDDIAAAAGVTRRLLYHYFPTKAHFFGAVWQRAHSRLRENTATAPADTVHDRIATALDTYLTFYADNLALVLIANRSSVSADPAVRGPIDRDMESLWGTMLDAAGSDAMHAIWPRWDSPGGLPSFEPAPSRPCWTTRSHPRRTATSAWPHSIPPSERTSTSPRSLGAEWPSHPSAARSACPSVTGRSHTVPLHT